MVFSVGILISAPEVDCWTYEIPASDWNSTADCGVACNDGSLYPMDCSADIFND